MTGCLGAKAGAASSDAGSLVREIHPSVLAVTGPHATQEVMDAVHTHVPKPHDPFVDLVPSYGVKLTPKHYAYLKISGGLQPTAVPSASSRACAATWCPAPSATC